MSLADRIANPPRHHLPKSRHPRGKVVRGRASAHWLDLARAQPPAGHHRIFIERAYALLAHLPRPLLIGVATFGHRVIEARHLRGIQRRSTASGRHKWSAEQWRRALLTCGILAPFLYVAMTLFVGLLWEGYSVVSRVPSELSAIGAPTRPMGPGFVRSA